MQRTRLNAPAVLALLAAGSATAFGDQLHVPGEFSTIQAAIDAAQADDEVVVAPGEYFGSLIVDKAITVRSSDGPGVTVLNGNGDAPVVILIGSDSGGGVLEGFTVTGGVGQNGGGLFLSGDVAAVDCVVTGNSADRGGGAFLVGSPVLSGVVFEGNDARWGGAVYSAPGAGGLIDNCSFSNNAADYGGAVFLAPPAITQEMMVVSASRFEANSAIEGGGLYSVMASFDITDSEFIDNSASGSGGGARLVEATMSTFDGARFEGNEAGLNGGAASVVSESELVVSGSEIVDNDAATFGGGLEVCSSSSLSVGSSSLWGNTPGAIEGDWADLGDNSFSPPPLCAADLAAPFGMLTSSDVMQFLALYRARDLSVDFAAPLDQLTFADMMEFVRLYRSGCTN